MAFDKVEYDKEYARENYDVIRATVPKGKRRIVRECADKRGISVSQLVVQALEECYELDLSKDRD
jgi:hypothetical protein